MKKSSTTECVNCGLPDPKHKCGRCKSAEYCSQACQKQHWKTGGHKEHCVPVEARKPVEVKPAEGKTCAICLEAIPGNALCKLPCEHVFHQGCIVSLRKFCMAQSCPECRAVLPEGPSKLLQRVRAIVTGLVRRGANALALTPEEQPEMNEIVYLLTQAADQGDAEAQCNLALLFSSGAGVPRDPAKAVCLALKAVEHGDADAHYLLGAAYFRGDGADKDIPAAVAHYINASDKGHDMAQVDLALIYIHGIDDTPKDVIKAMRLLRMASDRGNVDALFHLASVYMSGDIPKDALEAARFLRKACDQGHVESHYNLGVMFTRGYGVRQDFREALNLFSKAAEQGHPDALLQMGTIHKQGRGVPKNAAKALEWWLKAAGKESAEAHFNVAYLYKSGDGVPKDADAFRRWLHKAADLGWARAQFELAVEYLEVEQSDTGFVRWCRKAADQDYALAQYTLSMCYQHGKGVEQSDSEAAMWRAKALANGHTP